MKQHNKHRLESFLDNLGMIPPLAQVAFAGRCARRVEPIFVAITSPHMPSALGPVQAAVDATEAVGSGKRLMIDELSKIHDSSKSSSRDCSKFFRDNYHPSRRASASVTYAIRSARDSMRDDPILPDVSNAAACACQTVGYADWMVEEIVNDVSRILSYASTKRNRSRFPPGLFGAMWPGGVPHGWPDKLIEFDAYYNIKKIKVFYIVYKAYRAGCTSIRMAVPFLEDRFGDRLRNDIDNMPLSNVSFAEHIKDVTPLLRSILRKQDLVLFAKEKGFAYKFTDDAAAAWAWVEDFLWSSLPPEWFGFEEI